MKLSEWKLYSIYALGDVYKRQHLRCNLINCGFYLRNFFVQLTEDVYKRQG